MKLLVDATTGRLLAGSEQSAAPFAAGAGQTVVDAPSVMTADWAAAAADAQANAGGAYELYWDAPAGAIRWRTRAYRDHERAALDLRALVDSLRLYENNWATLTAAQKDTAMRQTLRAALAALLLHRQDG